MAASDSEKARAVVKGFFQSQPGKAEWPGDPEEACIKHSNFLKIWLPMGLSKPKSREAWKGAFPKMSQGDMNAMISGVAEARKWLGRKQRNLKTGDRTHPIIRDLMGSLEASNGSSPTGKGRRSTSPKGQAGSNSSPKGPESQEQSQEQGSLAWRCPILLAEEEEPAMAVDVEIVSVTSTAVTASSKGVVPAQVLVKKKPAMATKAAEAKEPAQGRNKVVKRPDSLKKVWHETLSHGLVKITKAAEKAYIVFKASDGKEKSLVNVHVKKGERQARIMAILLEKLQTEEVDKETLVKFKNWLLSRESEGEGEPAKAEGEPAKAED